MFEVYEKRPTNLSFILTTLDSGLRQSRKDKPYSLRYFRESDTGLITNFYRSLSSTTLWLRYFVGHNALSDEKINQEIQRLFQIANSKGVVLLAVSNDNLEESEEIIGLGEMIPLEEPKATAELALIIRDDYQGEGIGGMIAHQLVQEANQLGLATLQAETMVINRATLRIWQNLGLPYSFHTQGQITNMVALLKVQAS